MRRKSNTCIAVIKNRRGKLIMAGDRRVSCGVSHSYVCPEPKIRKKKNGILMGGSGDSALCRLLIERFEPPKVLIENIDIYIYDKFQPAILTLLKSQVGHTKVDGTLNYLPDTYCELLIGIRGRVYIVQVGNNLDISVPAEQCLRDGAISIDSLPIPYVLGCGHNSAYSILVDEKKTLGYNTKEGLTKAMLLAAEISPGCDANIDYISE